MQLRERANKVQVRRSWESYSFREPSDEDESDDEKPSRPTISKGHRYAIANPGIDLDEKLKWTQIDKKNRSLLIEIKQALAIVSQEEKYVHISDKGMNCMVTFDHSRLSMISTQGRVISMSTEEASEVGIRPEQDGLVFPRKSVRFDMFWHLSRPSTLYQGLKMPNAIEVQNGKESKIAEVWHLKQNLLRWPADSSIWIESIEPGALMLTNESGNVEIALKLLQKDIVPIGQSQEFLLETSAYWWQMYVCEIKEAVLRKELMDTSCSGIPGVHLLKEAVTYETSSLEMVDKTYSPEVCEAAFRRNEWNIFNFITVAGLRLHLSVGMGVETSDGEMGVILALDATQPAGPTITQIRVLLKDFPKSIIRKLLPWQVFATDQIKTIKAGDSFNCKIVACFEVLPVAFATIMDKQGTGNRFVVGFISGTSYPLKVKGIQAPSIERVLAMANFMGSARFPSAELSRFKADFQHQIDSFIQSRAEDDSQSAYGQAGVKANSVEIRAFAGPLSFLSHVLSVKGDLRYSATCDVKKGINLQFQQPNILISLSGMQGEHVITDGGAEAVEFCFAIDKTGGKARIRFEGPVAFKVQFYPYYGAVMTVSGWDHINEISKIVMAGTQAIEEVKRNRELNALPENVLKARFKRPHVCGECFPAPCNC